MMKKLVVVTGASSGIGMEFAKRFSRDQGQLQSLEAEH